MSFDPVGDLVDQFVSCAALFDSGYIYDLFCTVLKHLENVIFGLFYGRLIVCLTKSALESLSRLIFR